MADKRLRDNFLVEQGYQAGLVLENAAVRTAFTDLEVEIAAEWADAQDADAREKQWYRLQALKEFKERLEHMVTGGKNARKSLDRSQQLKEMADGRSPVA